MDLFSDTAANLDSIVSNGNHRMLRGQIHTDLNPENLMIAI